MDKPSTRILVIGGGIMGCGIAAGFLARGHDVTLLIRDAERGEATHRRSMQLAASLESTLEPGALSVQTAQSFAGWADVGLVIESVKEDLALKQQLFAWLDSRVPAAIAIGSNSSSLPISRIAQGLPTRSRMFGMHYFMPAHRVPLVEVVLGAGSDQQLAREVCTLFAAAGKKPVLVRRRTSPAFSPTGSSMP